MSRNNINIFLLIVCVITKSSLLNAKLVINANFTDENIKPFKNCLNNILNTSQNILIITPNLQYINNFLINIKTNTIIILNYNSGGDQIKNTIWKLNLQLLIIKTTFELENGLNYLFLSPGWDPKGKFLIVYIGNEDMNLIFDLMWQKYIINVCVLRVKGNLVEVYTYFPYKNGYCWDQVYPEMLGDCDQMSLGLMYQNKVPKVFKNCSLRITMPVLPPATINMNDTSGNARKIGYEPLLLWTILDKMNVTRNVTLSQQLYGFRLANGTFSNGSLRNLLEDRFDLLIGRTYLNHSIQWEFDPTHVYHLEKYKWHVPVARLGAQWKNIFVIFENTLWVSIISIFVLNCIIWWIIGNASKENLGLVNAAIFIWCSLLNGCLYKPQRFKMRYLSITLSIFALLVTTAYQSQLLKILLKPIYEPQISTPEELADSNLNIILLIEHLHQLQVVQTPANQKIIQKGTLMLYDEYMKIRLQFPENAAFMASEIRTKYFTKEYYTDSDGLVKIYIFKHVIRSIQIVMHFRRGHPFLDRCNEILLRILASGLFQKWTRDIDLSERIVEKSKNVSINFMQLKGAFYLLFIGYLLAVLMFFAEITYTYIRNNTVTPNIA